MSGANKRERKEERKLKKEIKERINQKCRGNSCGIFRLELFDGNKVIRTFRLKEYLIAIVKELSGEKKLMTGWLKPLIRKRGFIQQEEILDNLEIIPIYVVTSDSE